MSNPRLFMAAAIAVTFFTLVLDRCTALAVNTLEHPSAANAATPLDPKAVRGNESCVKCHASEIQVWKSTPHSRTFDELHRRPEAQLIANKLGLNSIKHEGRCVACHYTPQTHSGGDVQVIAGVSCESCHGGARDWIDLHQDYGGEGLTRLSESTEHRHQRILKSVAAGMRNPANVYSVAQSCLRCHTTADEQLVNVGGHSAGSLDFEFVSWSQGTIRHNFVRSDGKSNDHSNADRIRVMFVAGMIAELESSFRATAVATQKATYGVTVAKRGARAGARLKSVAAKVTSPVLDQVISIFDSVTLQLNNREKLIQAADKIAVLGYQFAEQTQGTTLSSLDTFIPPQDRFK